jgi:hypothetical protein
MSVINPCLQLPCSCECRLNSQLQLLDTRHVASVQTAQKHHSSVVLFMWRNFRLRLDTHRAREYLYLPNRYPPARTLCDGTSVWGWIPTEPESTCTYRTTCLILGRSNEGQGGSARELSKHPPVPQRIVYGAAVVQIMTPFTRNVDLCSWSETIKKMGLKNCSDTRFSLNKESRSAAGINCDTIY